jgi:hypothetical protein
MNDPTCKRTACDVVSPPVNGQPTFCSEDCEKITTAVHGPPDPGGFSWLVAGRSGWWPQEASSGSGPCQVLDSPAPAATATTASSSLSDDVLSAPEPGSADDVSAARCDENSLDNRIDHAARDKEAS